MAGYVKAKIRAAKLARGNPARSQEELAKEYLRLYGEYRSLMSDAMSKLHFLDQARDYPWTSEEELHRRKADYQRASSAADKAMDAYQAIWPLLTQATKDKYLTVKRQAYQRANPQEEVPCEAGLLRQCGKLPTKKCSCCGLWLCEGHHRHHAHDNPSGSLDSILRGPYWNTYASLFVTYPYVVFAPAESHMEGGEGDVYPTVTQPPESVPHTGVSVYPRDGDGQLIGFRREKDAVDYARRIGQPYERVDTSHAMDVERKRALLYEVWFWMTNEARRMTWEQYVAQSPRVRAIVGVFSPADVKKAHEIVARQQAKGYGTPSGDDVW